jgi:hypothetical protein
MWLIGVDEKKGVVPFSPTELGDWWGAVSKYFDRPTPTLQNVVTYSNNRPICALVFDTSARPFVITNPDEGKYPFVVPWRDGNRTRTANRAELLSLLAPNQVLPRLDILEFVVRADRPQGNYGQYWSVTLKVYVHQHPNEVLVVPQHRCGCVLDVPEFRLIFDAPEISFRDDRRKAIPDGIVQGPGRLVIIFGFTLPFNASMARPFTKPTQKIRVTVSMKPANSSAALLIDDFLNPWHDTENEAVMRWSISSPENQ